MKRIFLFRKKSAGFTFIEILIGVFLMLVVFLGVLGAYRLGVQVALQSRLRTAAIALANQKIELTRNLSYTDVGTQGGIPPGIILETEEVLRNGIPYTAKTTVVYIDDPFDGVAPDDLLPNDYKRVKVKISWAFGRGGDVILVTDIAPRGLETDIGGGNLFITVFNAVGIPIPQADIHVVNNAVNPSIDANFQTNNNGTVLIAGAPASNETYEIAVSKSGYSIDRTYGVNEVTSPIKPHVSVIEGRLTQTSFSIDQTGIFSIDTLSSFGTGIFSDSFADASKISSLVDVVIAGGVAALASTTGPYSSSGFLISQTISPAGLINWGEFSWSDTEPIDTDIRYHILYFDGVSWINIPDSDVMNNAAGFGSSPVDLLGVSTSTYPQIRLQADFSTVDASTTPLLSDWQVSWIDGDPTPIANTPFNIRGSKIIGTDSGDNPVYKYQLDYTTDASGHSTLSGMEWDAYTFVATNTPLDLIGSIPISQPIDLLPGETKTVQLFFSAENSLFVRVSDAETALPVFSASVRLYRSGYDETQYTDIDGETFYIPLNAGQYSYEITAAGFANKSGSAQINDYSSLIINLTPQGL